MPLNPLLAWMLIEEILRATRPPRQPKGCQCGKCRQCIGRRNGERLLETRGRDYFRELGRKGGRPRALTIHDLRRGR